jgi:hypothetical protein
MTTVTMPYAARRVEGRPKGESVEGGPEGERIEWMQGESDDI